MKGDFPLIVFTADTVARLTGLSVRQLQRWDRTGFFTPSLADPHRRRPHSRVYSFEDVVGLRTIATLRAEGVSFPELKKVRALFAPGANRGWSSRRFYVVGKHVFFTHGDAVVAAKPFGQQVVPAVLDLGRVAADVEEAVRQLPLRRPEQIGRVTRDRWIMNGVPVVAGTRIPTATIAWFARNGYDVDAILAEFPRLTPEDVRVAVAFEEGATVGAEQAAGERARVPA